METNNLNHLTYIPPKHYEITKEFLKETGLENPTDADIRCFYFVQMKDLLPLEAIMTALNNKDNHDGNQTHRN